MFEFEIDLPLSTEMEIDVTDSILYNYTDFSLVPLQESVSVSLFKEVRTKIIPQISGMNLVKKVAEGSNVEYVAEFSNLAQKKLKSGEWELGVRKETGKIMLL